MNGGISNWSAIKKMLKECPEDDLVGIIGALYGLSKSNKTFLEAKFLLEYNVIEVYKAQIQKHLAPDLSKYTNPKISIKDAKKAISDYKKATGDTFSLLELMVYYVECGTNFLCEVGDMYAQYYYSLAAVFGDALKIMCQYTKEEVTDYIHRLKIVVKKSYHMGWGYYDEISEMLDEAYPSHIP